MKRILTVLLMIIGTTLNAYSGVVVEGEAKGIEPINSVKYVSGENSFIINNSVTLKNPVSSDALLELIDAVNMDERIGVSVTLNDELIVYGKLHKRSEVAGMLETADNFIRSVVFAEYSRLRKYALPGNYRPQQPVSREKSSVIFLQLSDFQFVREGSAYIPQSQNEEIMLIPMATYTAPDGGYLPDYDALEKGNFQIEDKANADHMNMHKEEYMQLPPLREAVKAGQATAIVRLFRDSGINMSELSRSIIEGADITLMGRAAVDEKASVSETASVSEDEKEMIAEYQEDLADSDEAAVTGSLESIEDFSDDGEEIVEVSPQSGNNYAESIRQVFLIDKIIGNTGKIKLSRRSVNDGSYVRYRSKYLQEITNKENIDLTKTPEDFQAAFSNHIKAWEKVLSWLEGKQIGEGKEAFAEFYEEHGRFREELKQTYNECKIIADKYQYND